MAIRIEDIIAFPGLEIGTITNWAFFGLNCFSKYKNILKPSGNYYAG